ncbi:hypothetical protein [Hwangdonia lutea]|uniref:Uncharacterized protein n=1 Tax=Hwangdonia lutea TaxID=3075823 RepID=A0AA97ENS4_9FLAO|nr:hypothetical protein [Hwangdonia sp. SCSIO 19198]WOD45009.1 hypothetical protein RNZ46_07015 [Hwangdonia sp. SCSIO 19198]
MKTNLELLINKQTEDLWKLLKSKYKINIISDYNYSVNILERKHRKSFAAIWYDQYNPRPEYFAHELLHVKINHQGFIVSKLIDNLFSDFPFVNQLWEEREFRNLIGNIIEHQKMFHEYLKFGFEEKYFVGDYNERKCSINEIELKMDICLHPSLDSLKYITAKFFLMKGALDPSINYNEELKLFSKLAPNLFDNLNVFWNALVKMKAPYNKEKQEILVLDFFNNIEKNYSRVKKLSV